MYIEKVVCVKQLALQCTKWQCTWSCPTPLHKAIRSHSSLISSLQFSYNAGLIPRLHYMVQYDHLHNMTPLY